MQEPSRRPGRRSTKKHGAAAEATLLDRVRKQLDERGTLDVLRHGIEMIGLRQPHRSSPSSSPRSAMNPEIVARYAANRLRVVRQVRYSSANENCIDLVLFLNGIPVATAELKTDFTQSVDDAVDQYRFDRHPQPKGRPPSRCCAFPSGALVHFAVSNSEVMMTTQLAGPATRFLPFNKGDRWRAGNPPNPHGPPHRLPLGRGLGSATAGWRSSAATWSRERDEKKQITSIIFPRYHQLDATRKLHGGGAERGAGGKYLIQHSAGSGKTNSIAWSAHFLADLHDAKDEKLFDTVIVVSDRNVIDAQLQEAIFDFERTTGVVATIKGEGGSKSGAAGRGAGGGQEDRRLHDPDLPLRAGGGARAGRHRGQAVRRDRRRGAQLADRRGRRQAQAGAVAEEMAETGGRRRDRHRGHAGRPDGGPRWRQGHHLRRLHRDAEGQDAGAVRASARPDQPAGPDNLPAPFHVYSMRQAIEEGFILDVLKNYTPYSLAFKLAHEGKEWDEKEVERDPPR